MKSLLFVIASGVLLLVLFRRFGWTRGQESISDWLRIAFLAGLLLLVFMPSASQRATEESGRSEILLVDMSDSIQLADREVIVQESLNWRDVGHGRMVFAFGRGMLPLDDYLRNPSGDFGDGSELNLALVRVLGMMGKTPVAITVVTDGLVQNPAALAQTIEALVQAGNTIKIVHAEHVGEMNSAVAIVDLQIPQMVWQGDRLAAEVALWASVESPATLHVESGDVLLGSFNVNLTTGHQVLAFPIQAGSPGLLFVRATIEMRGDETPDDNTYFASARILPLPAVLLISNPGEEISRLASQLRAAGALVELRTPGEIPTEIAALSEFQTILLNDIHASELSSEGFASLSFHVSETGGGLIVVGGVNSFTMGGYRDSPIESLLPVNIEPPQRGERSPIIFLLVLDRSGSMRAEPGTLSEPISLAREAALRVVDALRPQDVFGLISYADEPRWEVELGPLSDLAGVRLAQDAIGQIQASGGTRMLVALEEAIRALRGQGGDTGATILLLSDGVSTDGSPDEFYSLARQARLAGVTISTIALGSQSDTQTLAGIAAAGGGRYHFAPDATHLPDIMIAETRAARAENIQEGRTNVLLATESHPQVGGFAATEFPGLTGYLAMTPRISDGAEVILESGSFGDPILTAWQVGLGRVLVWSSDLGQLWADLWLGWGRSGEFWLQMVKYASANSRLPDYTLTWVGIPDDARLGLRIYNKAIDSLVSAPIIVVEMPGGEYREVQLTRSGIDFYEADLSGLPPGNYPLLIKFLSTSGEVEDGMPLSVNRSSDWSDVSPLAGMDLLAALDGIAGVQLSDWPDALESEEGVDGEEGPSFPWQAILAAILLALWPLQIWLRSTGFNEREQTGSKGVA